MRVAFSFVLLGFFGFIAYRTADRWTNLKLGELV